MGKLSSLSATTSASAIGLIVRDHAIIVRERTFTIERDNILRSIESILDLVRAEKATGQICIHIGQGSPGTIKFEEDRRL